MDGDGSVEDRVHPSQVQEVVSIKESVAAICRGCGYKWRDLSYITPLQLSLDCYRIESGPFYHKMNHFLPLASCQSGTCTLCSTVSRIES